MLARLGRSELVAADLVERSEIAAHERPHDLGGDAFVAVAQHFADAGYLAPGISEWRALKSSGRWRLGSKMIFDTVLNQPLLAPVSLQILLGHTKD